MNNLPQLSDASFSSRFSIRALWGGFQRSNEAELIESIRAEASSLESKPDSELIETTNLLRRDCRNGLPDRSQLVRAGGLVVESLRREHSVTLYDVQLHAGLAMCLGKVAEMQTGEGKTFSGILPTFAHALAGSGVHVCAPNSYLASRDEGILSGVFARLGVTTAVRDESDSFDTARQAYDADVTYAAGQLFGFDYLRDQWTLRQSLQLPLGMRTLGVLKGQPTKEKLRLRGLFAAIVDEADHVLIDDASSPLLITTSAERPAPDTELHFAARSLAATLCEGTDFSVNPTSGQISLSKTGFKTVYAEDDLATHDLLFRPWHDYVLGALKAKYLLQRNRNYVVQEEKVYLVETSTGRIFEDRTWSDGLHQAVQAKENLFVSAETDSQGKITRQSFFKLYQHLCGMTGTANDCRHELKAMYELNIQPIPTRVPSQRKLLPTIICQNFDDKLEQIAIETKAMVDCGRAVLIGTNHIDQSLCVAASLSRFGISHKVLNGIQSHAEAALIAQAGRAGAVTVATHLAGRGTDIPLCDSVAQAGGLHVIASEHHRLARVDRQLVGRGARQGDPGSARFFIAPDDDFVVRHAPYLAAAIVRCKGSASELESLWKSIRSAQRRVELEDQSQRHNLMQRNQRPLSALSGKRAASLSSRGIAGGKRTLGRGIFAKRAS